MITPHENALRLPKRTPGSVVNRKCLAPIATLGVVDLVQDPKVGSPAMYSINDD